MTIRVHYFADEIGDCDSKELDEQVIKAMDSGGFRFDGSGYDFVKRRRDLFFLTADGLELGTDPAGDRTATAS